MKLRLLTGEPPEGTARASLPLRDHVPPPFAAAAAAAGFAAAKGDVLRVFVPQVVLVGLGDGSPAAPLRAGAAGLAALCPADRAAPKKIVLDARGLPANLALRLAEGALVGRLAASPAAHHPAASAAAARLGLLHPQPEPLRPAVEAMRAVAEAVDFARDLVVAPGNILTPRAFADRLAALEEKDLEVEVIGPKRLSRLGAGGLLAVGGAAASGPYLVTLRWRGRIPADPLVFVGKGITFDTGGVCVKPAKGMEEMRADMAGAAAAAGALLALAGRRSPAPAAAVLAIAENALGAASYRPSDVLRMLDGTTVEVVDTDAEGRLVLADAMAHARRTLRPKALITLATLTGSVVVALGHHRAGLFGTDPPLLAALAAAGEAVGERSWPLPIGEEHRRDLASDIADLRPVRAGRQGQGLGRPLPARRLPCRRLPAGVRRRHAMGTSRHRRGGKPARGWPFRGQGPALRLRACGCSTVWWRKATKTRTVCSAMARIGFYHLTRTGAERGAATAARPRTGRKVGGRWCSRPRRERIAALDAALWTCPDPDWLPHGTPETGNADLQPIWLTTEDGPAPNGARYLFLLDGAESRHLACLREGVRPVRRPRRGGSGRRPTALGGGQGGRP